MASCLSDHLCTFIFLMCVFTPIARRKKEPLSRTSSSEPDRSIGANHCNWRLPFQLNPTKKTNPSPNLVSWPENHMPMPIPRLFSLGTFLVRDPRSWRSRLRPLMNDRLPYPLLCFPLSFSLMFEYFVNIFILSNFFPFFFLLLSS